MINSSMKVAQRHINRVSTWCGNPLLAYLLQKPSLVLAGCTGVSRTDRANRMLSVPCGVVAGTASLNVNRSTVKDSPSVSDDPSEITK